VPLLAGALAAIDCEVEDVVERHSHAIVIGRVLDVQTSSRAAALASFSRGYQLSGVAILRPSATKFRKGCAL